MDLTLAEFVVMILAVGALLVIGSASISRGLRARDEKRALARRVICRLCLHAFETAESGRVVNCPSCGVANDRKRRPRWG